MAVFSKKAFLGCLCSLKLIQKVKFSQLNSVLFYFSFYSLLELIQVNLILLSFYLIKTSKLYFIVICMNICVWESLKLDSQGSERCLRHVFKQKARHRHCYLAVVRSCGGSWSKVNCALICALSFMGCAGGQVHPMNLFFHL